MKNLLEILDAVDVEMMFVHLQSYYRQTLGVDIKISQNPTPKLSYILKEPELFVGLPDHDYAILDFKQNILPALEHQWGAFIPSLTDAELARLLLTIEKNRIRQSIFENDAILDLQAEAVNAYMDHFYQKILAQVKVRKYQAVLLIKEIFSSTSTAMMYEKVLDFYKNVFGICPHTRYFHDDEEDIQSVLIVEDDYKKLHANGIPLQARANLNSDDIGMILTTYFKPIISTLSFEELLRYEIQLSAWHRTIAGDRYEFELNRYIGFLRDVIKDELLVQVDQQPAISVDQLFLILSHLSILTALEPWDTEQYLKDIADIAVRETEARRPGGELRLLVQTQKTEKYLQAIQDKFLLSTHKPLDVCALKTYFLLAQMQANSPSPSAKKIQQHLSTTIHAGLLQLLQDYQLDVKTLGSDRYKTRKLESIDAMLICLKDPSIPVDERLKQAKVIFDKNPRLHQTQSIGRLLYQILCQLFKMNHALPNYHMTLFQGLAENDRQDTPKHAASGYRRLGS